MTINLTCQYPNPRRNTFADDECKVQAMTGNAHNPGPNGQMSIDAFII